MLRRIALGDARPLLVADIRCHPSTTNRRLHFGALVLQLHARLVERRAHLRHANLRLDESVAHHRKNRAPFRRRGRAAHRIAPALPHTLEHGAHPRRPRMCVELTTCAVSLRRTRSCEAPRHATGSWDTSHPHGRAARSTRAPRTWSGRRDIHIHTSAYGTSR